MEEFKKEKFKQVLHYIINNCGSLSNVGKTVLYKILYFLDFDYYELYEEKMTGESYRKLGHGPAPVHFNEVVEELEKEGKIEKSSSNYGLYKQQKFTSIAIPNLSLLSAREYKIIQDNITRFRHMNATQISEFSHHDLPYRATVNNDIIDYELVFYRDPIRSVREYKDD